MSALETKESVAQAVHVAALEIAVELHVAAQTMTTQKAQGAAHWCADFVARKHGLDEDVVLGMAMERVTEIVENGEGTIESDSDRNQT
jgi:ribosomal protein L31E